MKKSLILVAVMASFAACQSGPAVETKLQYQDFDPKTAQEQLDADTLVLAVQSENKALCATIENQIQKDNCVVKVLDQAVLKNAKSKMDKNACGGIKEATTKTQCELIVENLLANQKLEKETLKELEDVQSYVDNSDLKGCKKLTDANFREQCEVNIYSNMATEQNDPEVGENIDSKEVREACKAQI